ncbi:MAG: DUF4239 domain-containing protein [Rhodocyclaceae bacterium]|jgi:hypothetical protein|nr:MAG: DUF4239 domain-containing protein [Rhodocyclaceae bacterium]
MKEFLFDLNSVLIVAALSIFMVLAIEGGYRVGARREGKADESFKSHVDSIAGALLGLLALLLGFTLSLSLQRYDSRSEAVVDEANAIGTTWLRSQMLPATDRGEMQAMLREYVDLRVHASTVTLADHTEQAALFDKTGSAQAALWDRARRIAEQDPNPVRVGLFIQALNEMIDSFGRRDGALNRHVPELVLLLLFATFLMAGAIVGYASGVAGHRAAFVTYIMIALIVVLVFVILDLDRPRRGLIQVSQKSLLDLQASIRAPSPAPSGAALR